MPSEYPLCWTMHDIGTLDQVSFYTNIPAQANHAFTLSFWYCAIHTTKKQIFVSIDSLFEIYLENQKIVFELFSGISLAATQPEPGTWHQIIVVVDDTIKLYIDSHLTTSDIPDTQLQLSQNMTLCIGGYTDAAGGHFDYTFGRNQSGWIHEVCWYNRALTANNIAEKYPSKSAVPDINIHAEHLPDGTVKFSAISGQSDDRSIFLWDFGDAMTAIGSKVTHHYTYSGTYHCRLTVITADYQQATCEMDVHIDDASPPLEKIPVFTNNTEGYACYRIPSIVCAANGDLIAFAEARLESCSDSTRTIRLVCKRSHDNGQTWSPLQIVARNLIDNEEFAVQQNAPVVDRQTGRIIVLYNKLEQSEFDVAAGQGNSRIFCSISDDNGATWHDEKDISAWVHRPELWRVQRPTLGHAIQLQTGRLIFAGMITTATHSVFQSQNYVFWSDDAGETWHMSALMPHIGLNEATAVELENGDVMINSRAYQDEQPVGRRAITIGRFTDHYTMAFDDTYFDEALIEPTIQASLIRYTRSQQADYGSKSRLLFSNPNHPQARYNLTIRLSYDEGNTWAVSKTIDPGQSAYSDLVIQDDMRIGVLYERGNHGGIVYTNFSLAWLTDGQDSIEQE